MPDLSHLSSLMPAFAERLIPLKEAQDQEKILIPGCHAAVNRGLYCHHGIYAGDDKVIAHLRDPGIVVCSMEEFALGDEVYVIDHGADQIYSFDESLQRARSMLGAGGYNLFSNNCEHFATWCLTGQKRSLQVEKLFCAGLTLTAIEGSRRYVSGRSPLPPALVFSLACLLLSNRTVQDGIADLSTKSAALINEAFARLENLEARAADAAGSAFDAVKDGANTAYDTLSAGLGEAASKVKDNAEDACQSLSEGLEDMCTQVKESLDAFFNRRFD